MKVNEMYRLFYVFESENSPYLTVEEDHNGKYAIFFHNFDSEERIDGWSKFEIDAFLDTMQEARKYLEDVLFYQVEDNENAVLFPDLHN